MSIPEVMQTTSAAPPALTFAEMQKPAEALPALVPKKQYYGFSWPTKFPDTAGAKEAGMSTTQKIGLTALGAIVLGSLFRCA